VTSKTYDPHLFYLYDLLQSSTLSTNEVPSSKINGIHISLEVILLHRMRVESSSMMQKQNTRVSETEERLNTQIEGKSQSVLLLLPPKYQRNCPLQIYQTINQAFSLQILEYLLQCIHWKKPKILPDKWILYHDNVPFHTAGEFRPKNVNQCWNIHCTHCTWSHDFCIHKTRNYEWVWNQTVWQYRKDFQKIIFHCFFTHHRGTGLWIWSHKASTFKNSIQFNLFHPWIILHDVGQIKD
jgi:hypothetical protein